MNTFGNAIKLIPMLSPGCREAVLITSEYHIPRSLICFESAFAHKNTSMHFLCIGAPSGEPLAPKCDNELALCHKVKQWMRDTEGLVLPSVQRWKEVQNQLERVAGTTVKRAV